MIILKDVALQLTLEVYGKAVNGSTLYDRGEMCFNFLGFMPPMGKF